MAMNAHARRSGRGKREKDEVTQTDVTATRDVDQDEITEITVRIRPSQLKEDPQQDFNIHQLRREGELKSVKVESLVKGYVDPKGRRSSPRYLAQLTTVIYNNQRSFRAGTLNISQGGALLDAELPKEFLVGEVEVLFIHEEPSSSRKTYFLFKGQVLDGNRIQFQSATPTAQATLAKLLEQLEADKAA